MSLLSELGFEYANDMFTGAMVVVDGQPGYIDGLRDNGDVAFRPVELLGSFTEHRYIPHEHFASWADFSYPTLGYRQDTETNFLGYVTRTPSVRRGFHFGEANVEAVPACTALESALGRLSTAHPKVSIRHYALAAEYKIPLVMLPKYTPFSEGLVKILSGEMPYFCTSAEFAVCPGIAPGFEILYRRRHIGAITPSGNIELLVDIPAIRELWSQEIARV